MTDQQLDRQAREVMQSVEEHLRRHLGLPRLGAELVSTLYIQVRNQVARLEEEGGQAPGDAIEELALAIYLTVLSECEQAGPDLLTSLKPALESVPGLSTRTGGPTRATRHGVEDNKAEGEDP
jgi:hypothetical protein